MIPTKGPLLRWVVLISPKSDPSSEWFEFSDDGPHVLARDGDGRDSRRSLIDAVELWESESGRTAGWFTWDEANEHGRRRQAEVSGTEFFVEMIRNDLRWLSKVSDQHREVIRRFDAQRVATPEERTRIANGEPNLIQDLNLRVKTIEEHPLRIGARAGRWTRGLPGSARNLPEFAAAAVKSPMMRNMPIGTLLHIDGDADTIIHEAHRTLIEQIESGRETGANPPAITLHRDLPPTPTGFISWSSDNIWSLGSILDGEKSGFHRVFAWDLRADAWGDGTGTIFIFEDNGPSNAVRLYSSPTTDGQSLFQAPPIEYVNMDPGDGMPRTLDPAAEVPWLNGWDMSLGIASTLAFAVIAWTLLAQGGIIETVTRTTDNKAAQRRARRHLQPEVEIVRVRRTHVELADAIQNAEEGDDTAADARRFRWIVSGHWRSQPYGPGGSLRRPTFIAPHLKGPEGAPVRRSRHRVFVL